MRKIGQNGGVNIDVTGLGTGIFYRLSDVKGIHKNISRSRKNALKNFLTNSVSVPFSKKVMKGVFRNNISENFEIVPFLSIVLTGIHDILVRMAENCCLCIVRDKEKVNGGLGGGLRNGRSYTQGNSFRGRP